MKKKLVSVAALAVLFFGCSIAREVHDAAVRHRHHLDVLERHTVPALGADVAAVSSLRAAVRTTAELLVDLTRPK